MNVAAEYFRLKAAQVRRLASGIGDQADPAVSELLDMAEEFEWNADNLETRIVREAAHLSRDEDLPRLH